LNIVLTDVEENKVARPLWRTNDAVHRPELAGGLHLDVGTVLDLIAGPVAACDAIDARGPEWLPPRLRPSKALVTISDRHEMCVFLGGRTYVGQAEEGTSAATADLADAR
jgi:hypothetical protein